MDSSGWFYQRQVPEVDELVMAKIIRVDDSGVLCQLLEYNQREATLSLSEVSKTRFRSIRKIISVGQTKVLQVLRNENSFIELTRRHLDPEENELGVEKYEKGKHALSIIRQLAEITGESVDQLCEKVLWPLYEKSDVHPYYQLVNGESLPLTKDLEDPLRKIIQKRSPPKEYKVEAIIELTCFTSEGIDTIKDVLKRAREQAPQINIVYLSAPEYRMTLTGKDLNTSVDLLIETIRWIAQEIDRLGGLCRTLTQPREY